MAIEDEANWSTARAFILEKSKREIKSCTDVDKLQELCISLMMQVEATKDMILSLMIEQDSE